MKLKVERIPDKIPNKYNYILTHALAHTHTGHPNHTLSLINTLVLILNNMKYPHSYLNPYPNLYLNPYPNSNTNSNPHTKSNPYPKSYHNP